MFRRIAAVAVWSVVATVLCTSNIVSGQCVKFDRLSPGTVWGGPAGNSAGDVVHTESGIPVSVRKFRHINGTGSFHKATVDSSWSTSSPNSVNTNNINLGFDFSGLTQVPTQVMLKFRDLGGYENLSINGNTQPPGELASGSGGGNTWVVTEFSVPGGRAGKLTINGPVNSLEIGGQEFWLDTVCVTTQGTPRLDHFKVYEFEKPKELELTVALRGQFERGFNKATVFGLTHFANVVSKNGERIHHKNAHLNWYKIKQPLQERQRTVTVTNQFGRQKFTLGQPEYLLVPTEKIENGSSFPQHLDHYKCYTTRSKSLDRSLTLDDQFESDKEARLQAAVFFCVPVEKRFGQEHVDIKNRIDHLVVYRLAPKEFKRDLSLKDQFGDSKLKVFRSTMIAVPTKKLFVD